MEPEKSWRVTRETVNLIENYLLGRHMIRLIKVKLPYGNRHVSNGSVSNTAPRVSCSSGDVLHLYE